ncbi:aromatic acid/H+ symport family MFS transporter [Arthrobacter sp. M4]|uniref:MFS transporter n=1 Tax=Arthrobacter sp. M4 TaxID=218160 RepID=UPI001CDD8B4A|nr:aromatic acid/H+ symport family MFS transporter [Arthrobacter sp. M4]MCA4132507.1 aromatic acid/H+ symport family MFS transporter [Arthrobacter sp. M4]
MDETIRTSIPQSSPLTPGDAPPGARSGQVRSGAWVIACCWFAITVDGYDLIVYGTVVPALISGEWALTPAQAGQIGSLALVGMMVGALLAGVLTDRIGRRRLMIACVAWFSLGMALSALSPSPELFGLTRLASGIGLGGLMPTAIAMTLEYARPGRRSTANAVMFSGYSIGGILAAVSAMWILGAAGWRAMFWIGVALGAVLLVVILAALPESMTFLVGRGRHAEAAQLGAKYGIAVPEPVSGKAQRMGVRALLDRRFAASTILFWLVVACGLLLVYGLNTWLAQIMREAGYPLGTSLAFLLALNAGAIVGTPLLGLLADRIGSRIVVTCMFVGAAASILLLMIQFPTPVLLALVTVAGACTIGTQTLLTAFIGGFYPERLRAAGLGWALGMGRIGAIAGPLYGGLILSTGWGFQANFLAFAVPALLAALLVMLVRGRGQAHAVEEVSAPGEALSLEDTERDGAPQH